MLRTKFLLLSVALSVMLAASGSCSPSYSVIDLGTLAGDDTIATAINNNGVAVGSSGSQAFVWDSDHGIRALARGCSASAVNDKNQVLVYEYGPGWSQGVILSPTAPDIVVPQGEYMNVSGQRINNLGHVAGTLGTYVTTENGEDAATHAMFWDGGVEVTDLGDLSGLSGRMGIGMAVNDRDTVVGYARRADNREHAFFWDIRTGIHDLGTLGGDRSFATDINSAGYIVGASENGDYSDPYDPGQRAYLWFDDKMSELDSQGKNANANAINNHNVIVGAMETVYSVRAVSWQDGLMTDLNDLIAPGTGWELQVARDINDKGQIVGSGLLDGQKRAFLLQPVPEPSSMATLALSLGCVAFYVRNHRRSM